MRATSGIDSADPVKAPLSGPAEKVDISQMGYWEIAAWVLVAAVSFHAAYAWSSGRFLTLLYLFALAQLARAGTWRKRCYSGLCVGMLVAGIGLTFFWRIFSAGSLALWYVFAFWIGLFVGLTGACIEKFGPVRGFLLMPFLWTGLEYFRSECYYLKFSWLSPGYAFAWAGESTLLLTLGVYGVGFLLMCFAACAAFRWKSSRAQSAAILVAGGLCIWGLKLAGTGESHDPATRVRIAGIQMEHPGEGEVLSRLKLLARSRPDAQIIVLSEYTFASTVPEKVREWCRQQHTYLVAGGTAPAPQGNFYDTAFVIGPDGEIVFHQGKSVPIQFFKDGLPAPSQALWESPWGKIGICICYDLSYRKVTDELVRLGAQALIVPTMDVTDWGRRQHELHGRIAPTRAMEYGVPIFRLASSGISQIIDREGRILGTAPYPGESAVIEGDLVIRGSGRLPADHLLAPASTWLAGIVLCGLGVAQLTSRRKAVEALRKHL